MYDVPALVQLMRDVQTRALNVVTTTTAAPSPVRADPAFSYVAVPLRATPPLTERRAATLALNANCSQNSSGLSNYASCCRRLPSEVEAQIGYLEL